MKRNGSSNSDRLVSVIIPTFRRPDKLLRALRSVLSQTYEELEILVIDDNGMDTNYSKQIVSRLEQFSRDSQH